MGNGVALLRIQAFKKIHWMGDNSNFIMWRDFFPHQLIVMERKYMDPIC